MNGHTEEKARGMWCPFARVTEYETEDPEEEGSMVYPTGTPAPAHNRTLDFRDPTTHWDGTVACCVASDCMAWRWQGVELTKDGEIAYGYCGLASPLWRGNP